ncbi:MAG TPA: hypothetical protein VEU72_09720 [Nitrosopumilaceae archaeon]|nr:hypothetical protein [Nitrosopumilaceae archaeon]
MAITKTVELDELSKSIMNIDRNIRSVVVIDKKGNTLHKITHQRFPEPNLERWNDTHFMECTFEISVGEKVDELYGIIRYHHSEKDNFIMFSFPFHKNVIIVTCTKKISPISFATKVAELISKIIVEIQK